MKISIKILLALVLTITSYFCIGAVTTWKITVGNSNTESIRISQKSEYQPSSLYFDPLTRNKVNIPSDGFLIPSNRLVKFYTNEIGTCQISNGRYSIISLGSINLKISSDCKGMSSVELVTWDNTTQNWKMDKLLGSDSNPDLKETTVDLKIIADDKSPDKVLVNSIRRQKYER